jgi:hypothetical protein
MLPKWRPHVACYIACLRRCDNSYMAWLRACCYALNTNDHSAPAGQLNFVRIPKIRWLRRHLWLRGAIVFGIWIQYASHKREITPRVCRYQPL